MDSRLRPVSAMSLIVCLMAQMMLSMNSLNCAGGIVSNAGKQFRLTALRSLKNPTRCSGNSAKSWLIMLSVGSNTASRMAGTCGVNRGYK